MSPISKIDIIPIWPAMSSEAGAALAEAVCEMPALDDRAAARALPVLADAWQACGRAGPAEDLCDRALACARAAGDRVGEIQATIRLGALRADKGRLDEARARLVEAIRLALDAGDLRLECAANNELGSLELNEGRMAEALEHYGRAEALASKAGDRRMQGNLLGNLGNVHAALGDMDHARSRHGGALAIARGTVGQTSARVSCRIPERHLVPS